MWVVRSPFHSTISKLRVSKTNHMVTKHFKKYFKHFLGSVWSRSDLHEIEISMICIIFSCPGEKLFFKNIFLNFTSDWFVNEFNANSFYTHYYPHSNLNVMQGFRFTNENFGCWRNLSTWNELNKKKHFIKW